jgi:pyruvate/oxaloacetate carboxyltransferase
MREMINKTIHFHDVTLRDGQQSLAATRMTTEQALRVLPYIEAAGFESIELWGGAILDSCIQYLDENPWDRLELFSKTLKNPNKIQALLRGQNLFAYKPFSDDLVIAFIKQSLQSGVKTMRFFDALNDRRNLQTSMLATKAYGGIAEAAICYSVSPVHKEESFVNYARELVEDGADRICLKDMSGILQPDVACRLLPELRKQVKVPITLHSHSTTGVSLLNAVIALLSGIDAIDTAITPFCEGSSHPSIEILMVFAEQLGINHELEKTALKLAQYELFGIAHELSEFNPQFNEYYRSFSIDEIDRKKVDHVLSQVLKGTNEGLNRALIGCRQILDELDFPPADERIFASQIPGGMLSNLAWQLKQMGASEALNDVMLEIPKVREDAGFVPLVTPTSQIIGAQATFNVLGGQRYQIVADEFRMLLNGELGRTPVAPNREILKQLMGEYLDEIKYRPASYLKPVLEDFCNLPYIHSNQDLLLHHLFGPIADKFLERHDSFIAK